MTVGAIVTQGEIETEEVIIQITIGVKWTEKDAVSIGKVTAAKKEAARKKR